MDRDKRLLKFLKEQHTEDTTPGLLLRAYSKGKKCLDISYGKVFSFYDLASLTKVIFTVTRLMMLTQQGAFHAKAKVKKVIPWISSDISFQHLLSHQSGAVAWKPYFKKMPLDLSREAKWTWLQRQLRAEKFFQKNKGLSRWVVRQSDSRTIGPSGRLAVYSDIGFFLLGVALEYLEDRPLLQSWKEVADAFDLKATHFNLDNKPLKKVSDYGPTERCPWRKKQLQGQVSDENAYALGGIAPHAGLFSTIDDVSDWILKLRAIFYGKDFQSISQKVLNRHVQSHGDFTLGFMRPSVFSKKNSGVFTTPSCGRLFSRKSFGHTGFTGCSVWFDPKQDVIVVLLANRVCPDRKNKKFLFLRPLIHEDIVRSLTI